MKKAVVNFIKSLNQAYIVIIKFKIDVGDVWLQESYEEKSRLILFKI